MVGININNIMRFDTTISKLLKEEEETPTRADRIRALDNLNAPIPPPVPTPVQGSTDTGMTFETEVDLTLYVERGDEYGTEDYDYPDTVTIKYKLHMIYGRRGLKGIQYELVSVVPFSIERTRYGNRNYDDPQIDTVDINLTGLKCVDDVDFDTLRGNQIVTQSIEIWLDDNYNPTQCQIEF